MHPGNAQRILILVAVLLAVAGVVVWYFTKDEAPRVPGGPGPGYPGVACTMEAKLCPDGSYVARTGPNCEFAACPIGGSGSQPQY